MKVASLFTGLGGLDLGLEQAGHEIILQVESDDRCASVLRTQFPRARLNRNLHALRQLPAETEVLAATLPWPEEEDDDAKTRAAVEHPWLPASRAAATEEHAHFFRLLATRPVSWVVLELPVSLLRWATAAVPARPPPIAKLVKELETLRYRWAYRVVDLPDGAVRGRVRDPGGDDASTVDSLNVSVATGILLHALIRGARRHGGVVA